MRIKFLLLMPILLLVACSSNQPHISHQPISSLFATPPIEKQQPETTIVEEPSEPRLTTTGWSDSVTLRVLIADETHEAGTKIIFEDVDDVTAFENAAVNATPLHGIVDIASPSYSFQSGDEKYQLWLSEQSGSIMDITDTHKLYILSETDRTALFAIISEA